MSKEKGQEKNEIWFRGPKMRFLYGNVAKKRMLIPQGQSQKKQSWANAAKKNDRGRPNDKNIYMVMKLKIISNTMKKSKWIAFKLS